MDGEITPKEVEELLGGENPPRVVDIRSPAAFDREHIPGSENVPFAELPNRVESLSEADRIITVCPHGQASRQAARLIKSYEGTKDARVESMEGGLTAWSGDVDSARPTGGDDGPQSPF
ncbi:rhodanese-like domain-containing protein [Haloprofundus salilacus]|uniref:rhodanese-like domain-containing protein n=1 Tax=Haloprofundus salilacus TaxID=2876190 RepID=UPI001CCA8761|nr:rhodanese-like domain-containing protein [Haloprofundus salilacus]